MQIRIAQFSDSAEVARLSSELGYPATAEEIAPRLQHLLATDWSQMPGSLARLQAA